MEIDIIKQEYVFPGYKSLFVRPGYVCRNICMDCLSCEPDDLVYSESSV